MNIAALMRLVGVTLALFALGAAPATATAPATVPSPAEAFHQWAPTPPMGWNSWDCFGTAVTEAQVKANADYMAEKLLPHGWQYVVVDIQWYEPQARGHGYRENAELTMDEFGRLLPAVNRFPSAAGGAGFKPLAAYVHGKGLKFGVHLLRGIPRQAVERNTPILGTQSHAADIADRAHPCAWNPDMWGVDTSKPGAQAYYDSVFRQLADWGVDFVKVDDLSRPYYTHEIEAVRAAIDKTNRPIVLSLSPGETPLDVADHVAAHANLWRISDDFWDDWKALLEQFDRCRKWSPYAGAGHWPDADMLPLGAVRLDAPKEQDRWTRLTRDEQTTLMTLWCIVRSPLILSGDLPRNNDFTESLITNDEVLAVDQHGTGARQVSNDDGLIVWVADVPQSRDMYVAAFNTRNKPPTGAAGASVRIDFATLGVDAACDVRDLWKRQPAGRFDQSFAPVMPSHGAGLFRLSPVVH